MGIEFIKSGAPAPLKPQLATGAVSQKKRRLPVHDRAIEGAQESASRIANISRLARLGVSPDIVETARRASYVNGSTLSEELFANGHLDEAAYYRNLAQDLNVEFVGTVDAASLILPIDCSFDVARAAGMIKCRGSGASAFLLVAPADGRLETLRSSLSSSPQLAADVKVCTPSEFERVLFSCFCDRRIRETVQGLALERPSFSAKTVLSPAQGFALGLITVALPVSAWTYWSEFLVLAHIGATLLFAGCVFLRVRAASKVAELRRSAAMRATSCEGPYPVYSVMVALYKEAAVAAQLCAHMNKLNWPSSRLEVIFICEESDNETIEALAKVPKASFFKTVTVPPFGPQTKPRALSYALALARGEFLVIYDAEDRPHPDQLMEAYAKFQREPERTACLQAPLVVTNGHKGFFARMFAFEYAALFGGLLPYLANKSRFLPLGGTSNHFRRSVLVQAAAWDPYNVTEDADLGTRLCRLGYQTGILTLPTLEDAPTKFAQWLPQRTRWFKGWMQTWLVHMRGPAQFMAQTGVKNMLHFQILTIGMVASALIYPLVLLEMGWMLMRAASGGGQTMSSYALAVFVIDFANIALGHFAFILLGAKSSDKMSVWRAALIAIGLPAYWILLSAAAWRAGWQLGFKPHFWEKTEHTPAD